MTPPRSSGTDYERFRGEALTTLRLDPVRLHRLESSMTTVVERKEDGNQIEAINSGGFLDYIKKQGSSPYPHYGVAGGFVLHLAGALEPEFPSAVTLARPLEIKIFTPVILPDALPDIIDFVKQGGADITELIEGEEWNPYAFPKQQFVLLANKLMADQL